MDENPEPGAASPEDAGAAETPTRLCPRCSALTETAGEFCPQCGSSFFRRSRRVSRRTAVILASVLVLLLVGGGGTALAVKHNRNASHQRAAAAQNAVAAAKRAETRQQIADRHASEREMQASITKWARKLAVDGTVDGPILRTSCAPIGGGSENLAEITVKYDCLAIDKDNVDGSSEGYSVHATMDFSTGQYQWGLGNG